MFWLWRWFKKKPRKKAHQPSSRDAAVARLKQLSNDRAHMREKAS